MMANNTSLGQEKGSDRLENTIEGGCMITLAFIAVIGNGAIIYVIYANRNLRALRNLFIASLSFSDFSMACTDMLYQAIWKLIPDYSPPHFSVCYFILLTGVLFGSASVFSLTAMTINRYIAISYPLHYSIYVTQKRSAVILILIWFAAFCLAIPPLVWRPIGVVCYSTKPSDEHQMNEIIYMAAEWLFWFVIPGIAISVSYCQIYRIARYQARQIASLATPQFCPYNPGIDGLSAKMRMTTVKERKAGRMVAILIGFWTFCWLPFFIVLTIHKFHLLRVPSVLMRVVLGLMFINASVNPIILTMHNREMKTALKKLFFRRDNRHQNVGYEMSSMVRSRAPTFNSSTQDN